MANLPYSADHDIAVLAGPAELEGAVASALRNPRWKFRTARGIAAELGASEEEVLNVLCRHPDIARRSILRTEDGRTVWAPTERPRSFREWIAAGRLLLARQVEPVA